MRLMKHISRWSGVAALALVVASCGELDVENPNAPDTQRALSDPATVEAVGAGSMRTWFNAFTSLRGAGVLTTQARSYSSSWNNGNLNFYSGVDNATAAPDQWVRTTRTWQNNPSAAGRTSIDAFWGGGNDETGITRGGFYTSLSAANDALRAFTVNGVTFNDEARDRRIVAVARMMQGASLMVLSLQFDKAKYVDENTDLTQLANLEYINRKAMRDSAVARLLEAAEVADEGFPNTPAAWTNGFALSSSDVAKISRTMAAMTLAYYPRDSTELDEVDWQQVADLTAGGMSTGTPTDFQFVGDGGTAWISELMAWFHAIDTGRLSTRIGHLLDPATQVDPWATDSPQPNSPDRRLGDGTFGDAALQTGVDTRPKTANGGTDFAWTATGGVMRPDRGLFQNGNLAHIRYDESGVNDPNGQYGGYGRAPAIMAQVNDLLRAEALIRIGGAGNLATAVTLIDRTRVTRGGLSSAATFVANVGSINDGPCMANNRLASTGAACTLWSVLLYEKEIELLANGPIPFWEARRLPVIVGGGWAGDNSPRRVIAGLLPGTPREMPVTYRELGIKGEALYTWGGDTPRSETPP